MGAATMQGLGGIGEILQSLLSRDPSKAASPYLSKIPGLLHQYMDPYIQAGTSALPTLEAQYNQLLQDPTALMSKIGGQFKASPGYQYNVDQATRAANQAAAAGGMAGSPAEQAELAKNVTGLASQDYNQFMNRALGLYGSGLGGLGGLERQGQQESSQLAEDLARNQMSQAQQAEAEAQARNQRIGGMIGGATNIIGSGADWISGLLGSGGSGGSGGGGLGGLGGIASIASLF
jgi:hypothetical protein